MTSSTAVHRTKPARVFWLIFPFSALLVVMIAGATLAAAPHIGIQPFHASPTPRLISWAPANIAKPTYTPSPVPTATSTSTPENTPTPAVVLEDATATLTVDTQASSDLTLTYPQDAAPAQAVLQPSEGGKTVMVSISEQHLYAYENGQLIYSFVASTGMRNSTATGNFHVLDKIPNAYGSTWNIWMPDWLGIYYSGTLENGIHALPILPNGDQLWAGFLGTPISFGCVVLGPDEALQLYNWVDIGTPVNIRW